MSLWKRKGVYYSTIQAESTGAHINVIDENDEEVIYKLQISPEALRELFLDVMYAKEREGRD